MITTGRVIEEQKNYFLVDTPSGQIIASATGGLRNKGKRACTGDTVDIQIIDTAPPRGVISAIHERASFINRPALANCSHLLCVCTIKEPPVNLETLDRILFSAQVSGIQPCLIINKIDLLSSDEHKQAEKISGTYRIIGFPTFITSAVTGIGVDELVAFCTNRITAFTGLSGVGKTSLLSVIFPENQFRIGQLSAASTRGTHTTTNVSLLPLKNGGYIADTPGLAFIDLPAVPEEDVAGYFKEIADCTGTCHYNNCRHNNEPGCMVAKKITAGIIAPWRYAHYRSICNEMHMLRKQRR